MKAEHRHQLHTNVLADRMGRLLQGMKSAPKSTSTLVWVFVLLSVGTFAVWQYSASAMVRERSALWTRVGDATHDDPATGQRELQSIDRDNPGTIPGRAARFQLARRRFQDGLRSLAAGERADALPLLVDARDRYRELACECVDVPLLAQEAMMGRATAEESLAGVIKPPEAGEAAGGDKSEQAKEQKYAGNLDTALEYYRELANKYPDSILGKKAEERAIELEQQSSRSKIDEFYAEPNKMAAPKR